MRAEQCKALTTQAAMGADRCRKPAKRDGFCTVHHPDTVKAREAKRDELAAADKAVHEARYALGAIERRIIANAIERGDDLAEEYQMLKAAERSALDRYSKALDQLPSRGPRW